MTEAEMAEWCQDQLHRTLRQYRPRNRDIAALMALMKHFEPARPMTGFLATLSIENRARLLKATGEQP